VLERDPPAGEKRGADRSRRLVGWTSTTVETPIPAGFPAETDYYVAVTPAATEDPFLTVGRVPLLRRVQRWLATRTGLGARAMPDAYVPAPDEVERAVARRIGAGLDPAAVEERAASERDLIAAARHDDDVAARNRAIPVGLCVVRRGEGGFEVEYGWFAAYR
jgi:hypothetical protein